MPGLPTSARIAVSICSLSSRRAIEQPTQVVLGRDVALEGAEDVGRGDRGHVVSAHRHVHCRGHLRSSNLEIGSGAAQAVRNALLHTLLLGRGGIAGFQSARVDLEVLRQADGHGGQSGRYDRVLRKTAPAAGLLRHRLLLELDIRRWSTERRAGTATSSQLYSVVGARRWPPRTEQG